MRTSSTGSDTGRGSSFASAYGNGGGGSGNQWGSSRGGGRGGLQSEPVMSQEEKLIQQQLVQQELDVNEALIQERKEEMEKVHGNIAHINDIFKDLAMMTEDQGEQIETIRGDLQVAADKTKSGNKELDKASSYQKASTKKLMFCVFVLMVGIAVVVLVTLITKN